MTRPINGLRVFLCLAALLVVPQAASAGVTFSPQGGPAAGGFTMRVEGTGVSDLISNSTIRIGGVLCPKVDGGFFNIFLQVPGLSSAGGRG